MTTVARIARASSSRSTATLLKNWVGGQSTTVSARVQAREAKNLVKPWLATATQQKPTLARAVARDSKRSLLATWLVPETTTVGRRAAARDSMSLMTTWAASASSQTVAKRAGARDARSLFYSWIVKEGFAKKAVPMRSPLSSAQLLYRWIIADGIARYGSESSMAAKRGLKPAMQNAMFYNWIVKEGFQKAMSFFAARALAAGMTVSAVALAVSSLYPIAKDVLMHKDTYKLVRKTSLTSARQGQKLALKLV